MDIKVLGSESTAEEREAVDSVLGPPASAWAGGRRDLDREGRIALLGGSRARSLRDRLIPVFHAVQERFGWIPEGAFNYICKRLTVPPAEAHGVATFYHMFSLQKRPPTEIHVCDDVGCRIKGAAKLHEDLEKSFAPGDQVGIRSSPCLGICERAPVALVLKSGTQPSAGAIGQATPAAAIKAVETESYPDQDLEWLKASTPQWGDPNLVLLSRIGRAHPEKIEDYRAMGGGLALSRSIEIGSEEVIKEVTASGLVGRGGAAFPTGRKWDAVAKATTPVRYVVCNADESEPGTFKDRLVMEGDPFALVEGMAIAGLAVGAKTGYLYIRGEYPRAARRMGRAILEARKHGWLGENILGSGKSFDIELRKGAGAYICGEETALFNSIEGKRGEPRNKPPFPVYAGLFGKPTVINNVETLVNVPWIIRQGGAAYAALGTANSKGRKLFCVAGHIAKPGVYETTFGLTLRQLIDLAGGVPNGRPIQAVLLGGAAGGFVGPEQLDVPLTFEGTRAIGASLGSGVVMVFDDSTDLGDTLTRIAAFFRDESCGQCVPCRVGTVRQEELVARLRHDQPLTTPEGEVALLGEIAQVMRDASICGLGHTASSAIQSAFKLFGPGILKRSTHEQ